MAAANWVKNNQYADSQLDDESSIDVGAFTKTMKALVSDQTECFDLLEAFLAGWARLSLLLFPRGGNDAEAAFRSHRGQAIRQAMDVPDESAFADRELRNSWMHFDERLDSAVANGTLGNRHRFVTANQVKDYLGSTLRVMEIDTLLVHYRARDGSVRSVDLNILRDSLTELETRAERALTG